MMCLLMPSSDVIITGIQERKYILGSTKPDSISEELYQVRPRNSKINITAWVLCVSWGC